MKKPKKNYGLAKGVRFTPENASFLLKMQKKDNRSFSACVNMALDWFREKK